jgi:hypothetical protein
MAHHVCKETTWRNGSLNLSKSEWDSLSPHPSFPTKPSSPVTPKQTNQPNSRIQNTKNDWTVDMNETGVFSCDLRGVGHGEDDVERFIGRGARDSWGFMFSAPSNCFCIVPEGLEDIEKNATFVRYWALGRSPGDDE